LLDYVNNHPFSIVKHKLKDPPPWWNPWITLRSRLKKGARSQQLDKVQQEKWKKRYVKTF